MIFGSDISQFANGFKRLSGEIDNYNHAVDRTKYVQRAFSEEMGGVNTSLNKYLKGLNGTQASFKGYITSLVTARLKTIALEVATAALNATITFGLSLALGKIVEAMDEWIHAEEKAAEAAKELRETGHSAVEEITKETESLSEVAQKYIELYSSTSDINSAKEELSNLQDDLIEKYGKEAEGIDLVNGKLSDQLEEIRQIKKEEAESFIFNSENKKRYQQALNSLKGTKEDERIANADSTQFFRAKISAKSTKELSDLLRLFSDSGVSYDKIVTDTFGKEADIAVMGDLESQVNGWKKLADIYKEIDGYNQDVYDSLMQQYVLAKEKYDVDKADADEFERQSKYYNSFDVPQDVLNSYDSLMDKAAELNSIINGDYSVSEKLKASDDLEDIHYQLNAIAKDYIPLQEDIKVAFASFDSSISNSIQSVGDLRTAWFETLDDIQKGSLKNIDAMKSALQSVVNGENISSDTFWQLAEFDTDHILNGAKMVGDEFQLTEEQIISLKDTYIKKQMESIQLRQTELKQLKSAEEMEARQLQVALDNWKFADKNLNNPKYRAEFEDLQNRLKTAKENAAAYGDEWSLNAILLRQYNASLGNTADLIQAAQSQAEKLSEAFVGRIDKVIDGINDQKDALTEEKEVLQDQLDILEAQADEIKGIIEDYEKVADVVKNTIQDEISAIEESYNKQIEALKAQNEEREEAINLTEKLNNLNNAKNNKVVTYTEAGGFQYGVNKEAVNKAQQEYDKALIDSQIAKLEKERDSATAGFEEYAKLWEDATKKATKAEEEELAARILGADWREKISEQDVEIFETYEQKYDEYGVSLNNITNIEIANVKKSIEAKDKEIKAKEDLIKEWQKYKTNVQNYVNDLKNTNEEYADSIENITLTESSNLDERLANFERFKTEYESMINRILELQDGVGDIEVNASVNMDDFTDGIKEVVEGIGTVSEKLAEAIKELGKMPSINSAGDVKYYQATGYQHYASGGVNSSTGLAWLDGTRSKPEVVLNNQDATKLYNLLHSMPVSAAQMFSSPLTRFAGLRSSSTSSSSAINITGTTINLPNVRDPQQFAREMERYLQTTLTESQIIPPRS